MIRQNKSKLEETLRMTAAVCLMLMLGALYPAAISRVNAETPSKTAASYRGDGRKEGIQVHGQWTIDVRNPDGKLVTRRKFQNALTSSGSQYLGGAIARYQTIGEWRIFLVGTAGTWTISEPTSIEPSAFPNLRVQGGGNPFGLELSGTVTAPATGRIDEVHTGLTVCDIAASSQVCRTQQGHQSDPAVPFTTKTLSPLVNGSCPPNTACVVDVVQGQIIQVTVKISFS